MVGVFKRSLSFPNKIPNRPQKPQLSHHLRSISLPSRSHPLISQLRDQINHLKSNPSDSLLHLKTAVDSLDDILQLPQTQESLRRQPIWVEHLLQNFLRLVDVYGMFQSSVLSLKEEQLAAQIAVRRKDESKIGAYVKARKKMAKEVAKLAGTVRQISRNCDAVDKAVMTVGDAEVVGVIGDVVEFTVAVSFGVFNGVSLSFGGRKTAPFWMGLRVPKRAKKGVIGIEELGIGEIEEIGDGKLWGLKKKNEEEVRLILKKMESLEGFICKIENGVEKVFRSLISTKVSLLNSLTH